MSISPLKNVGKKLIIFDKEGYLTNEVIQICQEIGINDQDLYERDISEFKEEEGYSEEAQQPSKIQQMRYQHYEKRRQVKINAVKETMRLIRGAEEEKLRIEKTLKQQATQMSVVDIKQNKNKELKLQQIIKEMEKDQLFNYTEQGENRKQTIQTDYVLQEGGYNPKETSVRRKNQQSNGSFHIKSGYKIQPTMPLKDRTHNKHRSYSQVKSGTNNEDTINQSHHYATNYTPNQGSNKNIQTILSDAQNISLASKSVVINMESRKYNITSAGEDDDYHSRNITLDKSNSKSQKRFLNNNNTSSLSPYSRPFQQNLHNQSIQNMNYAVENLDYDVKLKLVRKLMRMERNDQIKKDLTLKEQEKENEIKQELEQKEQIFAQNHAKVQKGKEEMLKKRMKDQSDHQKLVRMQVKERQRELENERAKVKKQQIEEIQLRLQLEQQKIEEEEKQSFLRFLERNEEKRALEQMKKAKYEEQIQRARSFMTEIEKEQQAKQQKHEQILAEKQKEISKKIETVTFIYSQIKMRNNTFLTQRQNRAKSNMIIREQEKESSKSHTIQKIIQSIQPKQVTPNNERRRNISVFNSIKINDIRQKKQEFERENSIKLLDKVKQYDVKSKQAEQFKSQIHSTQAAQKKEQFMLKREGVIENLAIQDYQWNLQRQKEIDKYKQKLELAKMNKNIKEEIQFLTQQGVKDMYNIMKRQKDS